MPITFSICFGNVKVEPVAQPDEAISDMKSKNAVRLRMVT
jgi:hypothetical protein